MKIGKQELMSAYVRPEQRTALKKLAKKLGVSAQSLMREGVDLVLKKYRSKS